MSTTTTPSKAPDNAKALRYLRAFNRKVYLPIDEDAAAARGFEGFEGPNHPHLVMRPMTVGEALEVMGELQLAEQIAVVAPLCVGHGGDFTLTGLTPPGDDVAEWMRAYPVELWADIIADILARNTPTHAEKNG